MTTISWLKYLILKLMFIVFCCSGACACGTEDRGSVQEVVTISSGGRNQGAKVTIQCRDGHQNSTGPMGLEPTHTGGECGLYFSYVVAPGFTTLVRNESLSRLDKDGTCRP